MEKSESSKPVWRRSKHCGAAGACVEVALLEDNTVAMRSSRHPESPILIFTPSEWTSFLEGLREEH